MAKKFVTEEGLSQVVDAVVDAIKKVSDKQITEEKVTEKIDAKITEIGIGHIEENVSNLERKFEGYVTNEALGGKIEEAIGVANVELIKEINKIREEYVSKESLNVEIADKVNPIIDSKVQNKIEQYNLHDFPEAKATLVDLKATVEDHYVKKDNLEELVAAIFGEASVEELKRKLQNLATVTPPASGEQ